MQWLALPVCEAVQVYDGVSCDVPIVVHNSNTLRSMGSSHISSDSGQRQQHGISVMFAVFNDLFWADLLCVGMQGQRDMDLIASNIEMQFDQTLIDMTM